jgi:predicted metallopeptidase
LIEYYPAPDIKDRVDEIIDLLRFDHVKSGNVYFVRSRGSQSRRTIARIHGLGRIWQLAMEIEATYIIEVISEQFDPLSRDHQDRVLIHELMHIPHGFQGGFRHHKNYVTRENVEVWFKRLQEKRRELDQLRKG